MEWIRRTPTEESTAVEPLGVLVMMEILLLLLLLIELLELLLLGMQEVKDLCIRQTSGPTASASSIVSSSAGGRTTQECLETRCGAVLRRSLELLLLEQLLLQEKTPAVQRTGVPSHLQLTGPESREVFLQLRAHGRATAGGCRR